MCRHTKVVSVCVLLSACALAQADEFPLTFTKLTGLTGGSIPETAVYRADLSGVPFDDVLSVTIHDNSFGLGGASGQFSGFDLDAIVLSTTFISAASNVNTLTLDSVFDYSPARTLFTPGSQRPPVDAKLFGTSADGNQVDNSVARLQSFDGVSTTAIPGADGFISMGDGGVLSFNLTDSVSPMGRYLYLGEVGDNGEVLAGTITVSSEPVPEPSSLMLIGTISVGLLWRRRRMI